MTFNISTTFWIQFLGIVFGIAMLYFTFVKYKRKEISNLERWGWSFCWLLLIVVAIAPYFLDPIIGRLNFYRRLDFFVVIGFFVLLGIGFYNYSAVKKMERKLEIFVRKQATKEVEKKED
ncbi:MAG: DUF2304 domain-containing protein [Nanoarchaeota archaeon]|nr:DUF2304 domain-containing protein [Nanoarchaeota archaeon]MBU1622046.1 DUF2304 domain-containing protein [Nanoarchaeota archaeon]MBU1974031.1 DUF2304 domain-containing protein [Nanoarchaeota archaeon]